MSIKKGWVCAMAHHFRLTRWLYFFVGLSAAVAMLVCSVAFAFQLPLNKTVCMTVPAGNAWRTLHCKKKPPGCQSELSGCLSTTGVYTATSFGNSYTELTYTACHWNNDPNTNCLPALPIVDCMTFDAFNPLNGQNCGKLECRITRTIYSCDASSAIPPYGNPPGTEEPPGP